MIRRLWIAAALGLALAGASGCVTLKPWERGELMRRCMQADGDPHEAAMDEHVHSQREGMRGASPGGGVSCGCS